MGQPKIKWTTEEEDALRAGVAKHGQGKWKNIQKDPEFNHLLYSRSNIDLKDKWRNLNVANGIIPKDRYRVARPKANSDAPATPALLTQASASTAHVSIDAPADGAMDDSPKCILDANSTSKYNVMINEAFSVMTDPNGTDISSLVKFIESRHEVPTNFRKLLTGRLRRLAHQGKLEKTSIGYKMPSNTIPVEEAPNAPKQKETANQPTHSQIVKAYLGNSLQDAAKHAAYRIVEGENRSFVAAEAVKEAERVMGLLEDTLAFKQVAADICDKCCSGYRVLIA